VEDIIEDINYLEELEELEFERINGIVRHIEENVVEEVDPEMDLLNKMEMEVLKQTNGVEVLPQPHDKSRYVIPQAYKDKITDEDNQEEANEVETKKMLMMKTKGIFANLNKRVKIEEDEESEKHEKPKRNLAKQIKNLKKNWPVEQMTR